MYRSGFEEKRSEEKNLGVNMFSSEELSVLHPDLRREVENLLKKECLSDYEKKWLRWAKEEAQRLLKEGREIADFLIEDDKFL